MVSSCATSQTLQMQSPDRKIRFRLLPCDFEAQQQAVMACPVEVSGYKASVQEQDDILLYIKKVTLKNIITSLLAAMGFVGPCVREV